MVVLEELMLSGTRAKLDVSHRFVKQLPGYRMQNGRSGEDNSADTTKGIIEHLNSLWTSPVVLMKRKDGSTKST